MNLKHILSAMLVVAGMLSLQGQTVVSPTITADASKVLLEKGVLDAQLINEIVVTKRDEIKTELSKRALDRYFRHVPTPMRIYALRSFDLLFSDASSEVKKKELLRNSAELALTIGMAEFYLQDLQRRLSSSLSKSTAYEDTYPDPSIISYAEFDMLMELLRNLDSNTKSEVIPLFFNLFNYRQEDEYALRKEVGAFISLYPTQNLEKYRSLTINEKIYHTLNYYDVFKIGTDTENTWYNSQTNKVEKYAGFEGSPLLGSKKFSKTEFIPKVYLLKYFLNQEDFAKNNNSNVRAKKVFYSPSELLLEFIYNQLTNSKGFQSFGFFQNKQSDYTPSRIADKLERYPPFKEFILSERLSSDFQKHINYIIKHYTMVQALVNEGLVYQKGLSGWLATLPGSTQKKEDLDRLLTKANQSLLVSLSLIKNKKPASAAINEASEKLIAEVARITKSQTLHSKEIADIKRYLDKEILPQLMAASYSDPSLSPIITSVRKYLQEADRYVIWNAYHEFDAQHKANVDDFIKKIVSLEAYVPLINNLANLDEAVTYDRIFKFIADAGEILADNKVGQSLNQLVDYLDEYAIIDKENNKLEINLEGIAGDLYSKYQSNLNSRIQFSLTVGVNTAILSKDQDSIRFIRNNEDQAIRLRDDEGRMLSDVSFVSEKIGVKFNAIDLNKRYIKNKRLLNSQKPIINNVYGIAYASGLLYRVSQLNSQENFDFTTLGLGAGITFFNNLDFSISRVGQLGNYGGDQFWNIGFDIQFGEYLSALNKKRLQNKKKME